MTKVNTLKVKIKCKVNVTKETMFSGININICMPNI